MIFIDSSAFVSLVVEKESFHTKSIQWWEYNKGKAFVTSNFVVAETLGWIRHKVGKSQAITLGTFLFSSKGLVIEQVKLPDQEDAWNLFQEIDGRGISMIDCMSFVLMKRFKIKEVFTFDQDFHTIGFKVLP